MRFRNPLKITSRTSSITNAFVQSIIPSHEPTDEEVEEALTILGMSFDKMECAYCGTASTDWDHLFPLVRDKRPTGYINEIRNLVPSCGPCNQSKGGKDWRTWMLSAARHSPATRGIPDIEQRLEAIERFVDWGRLEQLSLDELAGDLLWARHWDLHNQIADLMRTAQSHAENVRNEIEKNLSP